MGLLDNTTQQQYYQENNLGNYQFTSLNDIINQFMIAYVGEDKIISKIKRADVAFHAQRAMQELSFDTFKSIKSQQIDVPATLTMMLPHDYVNYTKLTWTDSAGIKHPLYPTNRTSNPFQIRQTDDDDYYFEEGGSLLTNGDFTASANSTFGTGVWNKFGPAASGAWSSVRTVTGGKQYANYINDNILVENEELNFKQLWLTAGGSFSRAYCVWQKVNVEGVRFIDLKATGESAAQQTATTAGDIADYGVLRVGVSTTDPATGLKADGSIGWARPPGSITNSGDDLSGTAISAWHTAIFSSHSPAPHYNTSALDLDYMEWSDGTTSEKELTEIDVQAFNSVYICVVSYIPFTSAAITTLSGQGTTSATPTSATYTTKSVNKVDQIVVTSSEPPNTLQPANSDLNSSTWENYKSTTPSENNNDDYEDDTYWPIGGKRYGLDPNHAQVNGSFFIDARLGKIHFSSNISGKTVILDYISDSLGTDAEMQVHKFAEEAMYKHILCGIMSAKANVGRNQLIYYKKDKFAAVRQAKLRLSNIKLEELTQVLRGKSKWIKH